MNAQPDRTTIRAMAAMKRPVHLLYGVDDAPPLAVTALSALQHGAILIFAMFTALEICRAGDVPQAAVVNVLSLGLLVAAVGTILQAVRSRFIGAGCLLPNGAQAVYLGPSIVAIQAGGLPLVFGMTIVAGLFEATIAKLWHRLRPFLPPELSGLVILLIAMQLAAVGSRNLLAPPSGLPPGRIEFGVAALTLGIMIVLNVWTRGMARLLCVLAGIVAGYAASFVLGLIPQDSLGAVGSMPLFALPQFLGVLPAFDPDMILPFAVAGLGAAMATGANITVAQRLDDARWVRPDVPTISRGTMTEGLIASSAGLVGTCGTGVFSANIGVMVATGVTSRRIAIAFGAIAATLALFPRFSAILATTPPAVVAGALVFASAFTAMSGLQIITSRLIDARKTLMIGLSLAVALAVHAHPQIGESLAGPLRPLVGSALVAGTLVGIALTALFRIGVRQRASLAIDPAADFAQAIEDFGIRQGSLWGARPDVIRRAVFALTQLTEAVAENCRPKGAVLVELRFDEFNLDATVIYEGEALEFPDVRPSPQDILESDLGARLLAGFILRRSADRIVSETHDGRCHVQFHFDH